MNLALIYSPMDPINPLLQNLWANVLDDSDEEQSPTKKREAVPWPPATPEPAKPQAKATNPTTYMPPEAAVAV
jgi:hypothetical protein